MEDKVARESSEIAVFRRKAERHWLAINRLPSARLFELLPITSLVRSVLRPSEGRIVDLMAGSGYLTRSLAEVADHVVAIDGTDEMLRHCPSVGKIEKRLMGDIRNSPVPEEIRGFSMVCCLAGLHHIFVNEPDGMVSPEKSLRLQQEVVLRWASELPPGGGMLIVDVPHESIPAERYRSYGSAEEMPRLEHRESHLFPLGERISSVWSDLWGKLSSSGGTLKEYSEIIREVSSDGIGRPADWFIDVVKRETMFGHQEYFLDADGLAKAVRERGFKVTFQIVPTPWVFESMRDLAWYFNEKFGFGESVDSPSKMQGWQIEDIAAKVDCSLGIKPRSNVLWVQWNLAFLLIER